MTNIPYNAVMLDLETMSTNNNAAITSIGAVRFWLNVKQAEFTMDQLFYMNVDLESCFHKKLHIDPQTIKWWMQQDDVARQVLQNGVRLAKALQEISKVVPNA